MTGATATLAPGEGGSVTLGVPVIPSLIRKLTTDAPADVALYASVADRSADYARLQTTPGGVPAAPVIAQYRTVASALTVAGAARGVDAATVYATVINRGGATSPVTLTLTLEDC